MISYSDIQTWSRCPKKYKYRAVDRLEPRTKSAALYMGTAVHRLLMAHYRGEGVYNTMLDEVQSSPVLFEDEKIDAVSIIIDANNIVHRYFDHWDLLDRKLTPIHVEEQMYVTIGETPVSFTPDLVVVDDHEFVWVVDHKTTTTMPTGISVLMADLQPLIYLTGVHSLYGDRVKGFIFDYIRKKVPTQPRLTKTGPLRVANLDNIDTTYSVLVKFITENAPQLMDSVNVRVRLAELADSPDKFFRRDVVYRTDELMKEAEKDIHHHLNAIKLAADSLEYPRVFLKSGYNDCSRCPFERLCFAELFGHNTNMVIDEHYVPREERSSNDSLERQDD